MAVFSQTLDLPIDHARPIKVIVIGAGISGITAAIKLPQTIKNLELSIFEKNEDIGGVWFENKYPGIASDIPSHAYQFSFASNPEWESFHSSGSEIHNYLCKIVDDYDVRKYVKLGHLFKGATWLKGEGKWEVVVERLSDNKIFIEKADIFLKATGLLNNVEWPKIAGLHDFKGKLIHSARYDETFDPAGKRIAIIGNGSTGIQIVPALQPLASVIDNYARSRSWVSPVGAFGDLIDAHGGGENFRYSQEEKDFFRQNPQEYQKYRIDIESRLLKAHLGVYRGSERQKFSAEAVERLVREKLSSQPDLFDRIKPTYPVGCKRLGAGPGYLEALLKENVNLIQCGIFRVQSDGILDLEGVFRPVDAIICATGFNTSLSQKNAPILGQDSISLDELWTPNPEAYLGLCPVKMPNFFMLLCGPNSVPLATMIPMVEFQVDYVAKVIHKIQREHVKSIVVSEKAKDAFITQADAYFAKTVLTDDCASWLKGNGASDGRIQAIWPGSLIHARTTLSNPRWEDFEYELLPELEGNPLSWMGNGLTSALIEGGFLPTHLVAVDGPAA